MKIKGFEAFKVSVPLNRPAIFATRQVNKREFTLVRLETDDGIEGWGMCWWHHPADIAERYLKPIVMGSDPLLYERIWNRMYSQLYRERKGGAISAISAVDLAIWDIISKHHDLPLYKVIGGGRDEVDCYASDGYYRQGEGVEELLKEVKGYVDSGFRAVKLKVGKLPLREEYERVRQVRELIGEDRQLMLDANNGYSRPQALKAARLFEKLDVDWYEEPLNPNDLDGMSELRAKISLPIAAGELDYLRYSFAEMIKKGAVDIIQPDVMFVGGVTEFLRVAALASSFNIPVAPHAEHNVHAQLVAALPNCVTVEYFVKESDVMKDMHLFKTNIRPDKNGKLKPSQKPGNGMDVDMDRVEEYRADKSEGLADTT